MLNFVYGFDKDLCFGRQINIKEQYLNLMSSLSLIEVLDIDQSQKIIGVM